MHLSGGYVEMHFHFFVVVAIMTLYQDWVPFSVAIGYVVLHHGILGVLSPMSVYNHPAAWEQPWEWALIHGAFVLAASVANLLAWRLNEHQALHDALTGLANRALLKDRVEHALGRTDRPGRADRGAVHRPRPLQGRQRQRSATPPATSCCAWSATASRRASGPATRSRGSAATSSRSCSRTSTTRRDAAMTAERMLDVLAEPFALEDRQVTDRRQHRRSASATAGRQTVDDARSADADVAMYAAKAAGRGRFAMFEAGDARALVQRPSSTSDLRLAVERGELVLQYQPIVGLTRASPSAWRP